MSPLSFHIIISSGTVGLIPEGAPGRKDVMGSLIGGHASHLPKLPGNEACHLSSAAVAHLLPTSQAPTPFSSLLEPPTFPGICPAGPSSLPILKLHRLLLLEASQALSFPSVGSCASDPPGFTCHLFHQMGTNASSHVPLWPRYLVPGLEYCEYSTRKRLAGGGLVR